MINHFKLVFKLIYLLFFVFVNTLFAQPTKILKGKIIEKESLIPIPYATVKLLYSNKSTVSNAEGSFNLDVSADNSKDSIVISCMGYKPLKIEVESMKKDNVSIFSMKENKILLNEVTITPLKVTAILNEAIKISNSRYSSPLILKGYYRESVKRDSFLSKYADGLVEYYVERNKKNTPKILLKVTESRVKELPMPDDEEKVNALDNSLINIASVVEYISPMQAGVMDSTKFNYYNYRLSEISDNGKEIYCIDFSPIKTGNNIYFTGKVYIDKTTNLIMSLAYKAAAPANEFLKSISLFGLTIGANSFDYVIKYKLEENQYYLAYVAKNALTCTPPV